MTKADILAELPRLGSDERRQVFERLCELEEAELLNGVGPTPAEMKILDEALAEYQCDGDRGIPWREALNRIRSTKIS